MCTAILVKSGKFENHGRLEQHHLPGKLGKSGKLGRHGLAARPGKSGNHKNHGLSEAPHLSKPYMLDCFKDHNKGLQKSILSEGLRYKADTLDLCKPFKRGGPATLSPTCSIAFKFVIRFSLRVL